MAVVSEAVRVQVVTQAGGVCEYCRYPEEFNSGRFAVDHITPRDKGGANDLANYALSCRGCNERKQAATDRKSTRLNSSHSTLSRMPSSA